MALLFSTWDCVIVGNSGKLIYAECKTCALQEIPRPPFNKLVPAVKITRLEKKYRVWEN